MLSEMLFFSSWKREACQTLSGVCLLPPTLTLYSPSGVWPAPWPQNRLNAFVASCRLNACRAVVAPWHVQSARPLLLPLKNPSKPWYGLRPSHRVPLKIQPNHSMVCRRGQATECHGKIQANHSMVRRQQRRSTPTCYFANAAAPSAFVAQ